MMLGNPAGEPKLLQGTLEIPEGLQNSQDPDIKEIVDRYFKRFNMSAFAFNLIADDKKVVIRSKIIQRASLSFMDYDFRRPITMDLANTDSKSIDIPDLNFTAMAGSPLLEAPDDRQSTSIKELPQIEKLVGLNKDVLFEMKLLNMKNKFKYFGTGLLSVFASGIYYTFDGIINLIGLPSYPILTNNDYIL